MVMRVLRLLEGYSTRRIQKSEFGRQSSVQLSQLLRIEPVMRELASQRGKQVARFGNVLIAQGRHGQQKPGVGGQILAFLSGQTQILDSLIAIGFAATGLQYPTHRRRLQTEQIIFDADGQIRVVVIGLDGEQLFRGGAAVLDHPQGVEIAPFNESFIVGAQAERKNSCKKRVGIFGLACQDGIRELARFSQFLIEGHVHLGVGRHLRPAVEHAVVDKKLGVENVQPVEFSEQKRRRVRNRAERVFGVIALPLCESFVSVVEVEIVHLTETAIDDGVKRGFGGYGSRDAYRNGEKGKGGETNGHFSTALFARPSASLQNAVDECMLSTTSRTACTNSLASRSLTTSGGATCST